MIEKLLKSLSILLFLGISLLYADKGSQSTSEYLKGPNPEWSEEVLMGLFANKNILSIRVKTGGCSQKKDFWIWCTYDEKSKNEIPHYQLTIYRIKQDNCKAYKPSGELIEYDLRKELGLPDLYTYSISNSIKSRD